MQISVITARCRFYAFYYAMVNTIMQITFQPFMKYLLSEFSEMWN